VLTLCKIKPDTQVATVHRNPSQSIYIFLEPTPSTVTHRVVIDTKWGFGAFQEIEQYNSFQDGWVKKLKDIHEEHEE
jgi:predicted cupin superfamily sugar epimerase